MELGHGAHATHCAWLASMGLLLPGARAFIAAAAAAVHVNTE